MKSFIIIFLLFTQTNLFCQNIFHKKDIVGRYYIKDSRGKYVLILKKNGKVKDINHWTRLGVIKHFGNWYLEGDSIRIKLNYKRFEGRTNYNVLDSVFNLKIEKNALCKTYVYKDNDDQFNKVCVCYKKFGVKSDIYPSMMVTKIENPGYEGAWRNEKK